MEQKTTTMSNIELQRVIVFISDNDVVRTVIHAVYFIKYTCLTVEMLSNIDSML